MNSNLIYIPQPKPNAAIRLICFSYAGGGAATYTTWQSHLNKDVELAIIQLPGRGIRASEAPYKTMAEMIKALFFALEKIGNKPFMFFGHSMGARVAYELTLMLNRFRYPLPVHFFASGSIAPCISKTSEPTYHLPDIEFIKKLDELNGSPAEVLANIEMMQLILPTLRADFKIIETYYNKSSLRISTAVSVLVGNQEKIELADIEAWLPLFHSHTGIHWISGDHFFIENNKKDVLITVNSIIENYLK